MEQIRYYGRSYDLFNEFYYISDLKIHTLIQSQEVPISLSESWEFFSKPDNLNEITPPDLEFRITSGKPDPMHDGQIVTYKIRVAPLIWNTWVTEIKGVIPEKQFIDEQRSGPYKFWHHLHRFTPHEGGVLMEDVLHYALPLGGLGELFGGFIHRKVKGIFAYREDTLNEFFPGAKRVS